MNAHSKCCATVERRHAGTILVALSCTLSGCDSFEEDEPHSLQPAGWDAEIRLAEAPDLDPDTDTVEVEINAGLSEAEFSPGQLTPIYGYSGGIPGPLLRARVGDRVVVHFQNDLPEATTIHWHGVRVPAAMDGAAGHTQHAIESGASFTYDFIAPDAGTFWYHPHFNTAAQVGNGLYGALVVEDPAETAVMPEEVVLVLSDIALDKDGALLPADASGDLATLFGREGNVVLVNGRVRPTLLARPGVPQRWRLVNAAKTRYFQLGLEGHSFVRIGGDGGLAESAVEVERPVIVPGERSDLLFVPQGEPGTEVAVRWIAYDRGWGTTFNRPDEDLFVIRFVGEPVIPEPLPSLTRSIPSIDVTGATEVNMQLTSNDESPLVLGINGVPHWLAPPLPARIGETQVWTVQNTISWAHPFHLHGFFFQVLDQPGPREWRDTVNIPVDQTVRIAVQFDERPGMWLFHCHILDHADAGMMGVVMLER